MTLPVPVPSTLPAADAGSRGGVQVFAVRAGTVQDAIALAGAGSRRRPPCSAAGAVPA
ncbi:hypothetical protein [Kitasatospora phosalacinea]|uniref:Uncharacterized protein n=1 Tax=Kitasatospora phosalacinea TaxID=2065 RepID=A0A9W6PL12_9ACTN|nr:hypothetical protein [Kitasatospora phosalacinea]GLW56828.1 hypothetical protein Kpho01_48390 [Kitasatospora phosalacinea]